ncbi:MAG: two-component system chemotaxis response regulator CheB [Candidatus Omnitrophota bacterium]|jgi:two-component system chemotaxis response regulator CheB
MLKKIRVMIVDDSALMREVLKDTLESRGTIDVVYAAKDGLDAVSAVVKYKPDLMVLDLIMPVMGGLETLKKVMLKFPLPVIMFSAYTREGATITVKTLEYGAVDFILKPTTESKRIEEISDNLIPKIELLIHKKRSRVFGDFGNVGNTKRLGKTRLLTRDVDVIAVGSSTGGVRAANKILSRLPMDFPPIVWVQHMPENFVEAYVKRLDTQYKFSVQLATDGDQLKRGVCYFAPGKIQMHVQKKSGAYFIRLKGIEKVSGFAPSCDVLFTSVAEQVANKALGVILTGMGSDGTEGLCKMYAAGAYILGQDEKSSVIYGMPKSAHEAGCVNTQVDIDAMSASIMQVCGL